MEAEKSILAVLSKLMDSDDKNSTRRKTRRLWIKRRIVSGYFTI